MGSVARAIDLVIDIRLWYHVVENMSPRDKEWSIEKIQLQQGRGRNRIYTQVSDPDEQ